MARPNGQAASASSSSATGSNAGPANGTRTINQPDLSPQRIKSKEDQTIRATVPVWDEDCVPMETKDEEFTMVDEFGTVCFWYPPSDRSFPTTHTQLMTHDKIEQYINESVDKYGLHHEQALGILLYHDYNITRARQELQEYRPAETGIDAWDADDRTMFETAYRLHAKSFLKIKETLPNKKIADLVHYYYRWKKTQNCPKRKSKGEKGGDQYGRNRRQMELRDRSYPSSSLNTFEEDTKLLSVSEVAQDLLNLKNTQEWIPRVRKEKEKRTEREITNVRSKIQKSKQAISAMVDDNALDFDEVNKMIDKEELKESKLTPKWNDAAEIYKFTISLRNQGTNFEAISKVIRTKTAQQLQEFYDEDLKTQKFKFTDHLKVYLDRKKGAKKEIGNA